MEAEVRHVRIRRTNNPRIFKEEKQLRKLEEESEDNSRKPHERKQVAKDPEKREKGSEVFAREEKASKASGIENDSEASEMESAQKPLSLIS